MSARETTLWHPSRSVRALPAIVISCLMFTLIGMGALANDSCGGAQTGASGFAACSTVALEQDVGNVSLLSAVASALASADYLQAIAALVAKIGGDEVRCAVLAIEDVAGATGSGSGSGSATPALEPRTALLRARAAEVAHKYGWR